MSQLIPKTDNAIDVTFQWRTHGQEYLYPRAMSTRHLFNTLRMIWNHKMPTVARIFPYKQWNGFSPFYTDEYLIKSIRQLALELAKRDLTLNQKKDLEHMIKWLATPQLEGKNNASIQ